MSQTAEYLTEVIKDMFIDRCPPITELYLEDMGLILKSSDLNYIDEK